MGTKRENISLNALTGRPYLQHLATTATRRLRGDRRSDLPLSPATLDPFASASSSSSSLSMAAFSPASSKGKIDHHQRFMGPATALTQFPLPPPPLPPAGCLRELLIAYLRRCSDVEDSAR
ncbi:hypothetical protein TYRP_016886 [Tyrophagus putrescentiae]|nr:hypothetical protein TYRP_016886 [Tyrophagus putrescentiae]